MKFYTLIYTLIFFIAVIEISCKKNEKLIVRNLNTKHGILPIMVPNNNEFEILTEKYIRNKNYSVACFSDLNWAKNPLNGGFLVAKNGQIIYENYNGYSDLLLKNKIDKNTSLHIASVSKMITATAILKLVEANEIDLDQKLNTILPTFPFDLITIRTLLNHRSGLKNYAYFTMDKKVWDSKIVLRNQDILDILAKKIIPLEFPTNTKFSYCNTNYALLALVIEKITGLKYTEAMQKMIFEPLGMKDTYVFDYDLDLGKAVPSYKGNGTKYPMDFLDAIYGDKNIYSTPQDLLKLDMARRSKYFLNDDLNKQLYSGYSFEKKGTKNYGLGIRMVVWETGEPFYFHNGWWHGNTSSYITLGKEKVTIIALSNKFSSTTYRVKSVASLFGDYPFKVNDSI
jgi:CubicO group peptidase (beta-lactamase class C family)